MSRAAPRKTYTIERQQSSKPPTPGDAPAKAVTPDPVTQATKAAEPARSGSLMDISNADLLTAIETLRSDLSAISQGEPEQFTAAALEAVPVEPEIERTVQIEIARMVRMIAQAKNELATIRHPDRDDDKIQEASSQLEEIIRATEKATDEILEATEQMEKVVAEISELARDDLEIQALADRVGMKLVSIMEACNFQDITGQRITKVIKTMRFVEERIAALIEIWGPEAFKDLPVEPLNTDCDESLLNGPQLGNEGISQEEIDALFA